MEKCVRMIDIAEKMGISTFTVSKALLGTYFDYDYQYADDMVCFQINFNKKIVPNM